MRWVKKFGILVHVISVIFENDIGFIIETSDSKVIPPSKCVLERDNYVELLLGKSDILMTKI